MNRTPAKLLCSNRACSASHCALLVAIATCAGTAAPPSHIVIVLEENRAITQIIGSSQAPYINSLAANGLLFTNYYALTHPSQPNYIQLFSGANQGVTTDAVPPAGIPWSTPNLGAELLAAGRTFSGYFEGLAAVGASYGSLGYRPQHNPVVYWQATPQGPNQLPPTMNQPFSNFPTNYQLLPTVSLIAPDVYHDIHDGTIAEADAWLHDNLDGYAKWAMDNNSLLIVTFDEDQNNARNRIMMIMYGPMVRSGQISTVWTHHNLLRTIEDMYATTHAGAAAKVAPIVGAFVDDPVVQTLSFRGGESGYTGVADTWIEQPNPDTQHGADSAALVSMSPLSQGLIRFDHIIGEGAGTVPQGAIIKSAKLMIYTGNVIGDSTAFPVSLHRMLVPWNTASTWNSLGGGIGIDGSEAMASPDFTLLPNVINNWAIFDVTSSISMYVDGSAANLGWVFAPGGADSWRWFTSEASSAADRPRLEITYATAPLPTCPTIIRQPADTAACPGGAAEFMIEANGTAPLQFAWYHDTELIGSSTGSTLHIEPVSTADIGVYWCIVSNACSSIQSRSALLTICAADFNCDGGVDGADTDAFFHAWEAGESSADVNADGGVDGADVEAFFLVWEAGGC